MSGPNVVAEFLAWVKDNYGDSVRLALQDEITKNPCEESRAGLYSRLWKVLGTERIPGIRQEVNLKEIQYDS